MKHKKLVILGTSHIAQQSLDEVEKTINKEKPDIICLELDKKRLFALLNEGKTRGPGLRDIRRIGVKGYMFSSLGAWAERKLGDKVGVKPGSEMVKAAKIAKAKRIKINLIDQDIETTLKKLSASLTWKEKWHFFVDIIKAVIFRKPEITFDLRTVPNEKIIKKLTRKVKVRYPNIYRVLITERNEFMAKKLARMLHYNPDKKILAIVGAGHEKDIMDLVKKHLKEYKKKDVEYSYSIG